MESTSYSPRSPKNSSSFPMNLVLSNKFNNFLVWLTIWQILSRNSHPILLPYSNSCKKILLHGIPPTLAVSKLSKLLLHSCHHCRYLRILQTDASDEYWAAILLEEKNSKRSVCGYKSGKFKQSEAHYHSTFKEILAVKRGIEKFQFHLIVHHFLIEIDMSSFLKMLKFKRKMLPQEQLLRWSNWFSQ